MYASLAHTEAQCPVPACDTATEIDHSQGKNQVLLIIPSNILSVFCHEFDVASVV